MVVYLTTLYNLLTSGNEDIAHGLYDGDNKENANGGSINKLKRINASTNNIGSTNKSHTVTEMIKKSNQLNGPNESGENDKNFKTAHNDIKHFRE